MSTRPKRVMEGTRNLGRTCTAVSPASGLPRGDRRGRRCKGLNELQEDLEEPGLPQWIRAAPQESKPHYCFKVAAA